MKTIALEGVIGWDVLASDIRKKFEEAKGDDIDLIVHSPGGSVYEGIAIYNTIKDYRRQGGKVNARVIGLAASMASYVPLAADRVAIEDNAIWMIHNPWLLSVGDQRQLRKTADLLEGLTALLATAYEKKTGKEKSEIRQMMDDETYLFGQEIIDSGFADEIIPAGDGAEDKEQALAVCKIALDEMKSKMQSEPEKQQLDKVAALLKTEEIAGVSGNDKTAAKGGEILREEVEGMEMTLDVLKKDYSAVYAEAVQVGVTQERSRVAELRSYAEADPENAKVAVVVAEAIASGKTASEINAKLQVAIRDGGKAQGENPPDVHTDMKTGAEDEDKIVKDSVAKLSKLGV